MIAIGFALVMLLYVALLILWIPEVEKKRVENEALLQRMEIDAQEFEIEKLNRQCKTCAKKELVKERITLYANGEAVDYYDVKVCEHRAECEAKLKP